jgi:hypothetical protein
MNEERKCVQNFCRKPQEKIATYETKAHSFEDSGLTNWTALTLNAENIQTKTFQWEEEQVFHIEHIGQCFLPSLPCR